MHDGQQGDFDQELLLEYDTRKKWGRSAEALLPRASFKPMPHTKDEIQGGKEMLFVLIFAGFGILMWVAAGALFYARRKQLRKSDLMRQVKTSQAAEVATLSAGTPVEVKGFVRCEEPL